jgi:hypothetical protein
MSEEEKIPEEDKSVNEDKLSQEENKNLSEENNQSLITETQHKENMEVHHHGHVHYQKKWKEYLFQFFMLFLAVFCGYLAEYQLEQNIERHREKEYVQSMLSDLKLDTLKIKENIYLRTRKILMIDSLIHFLNSPAPNVHGQLIYYLGRRVTRVTHFQSNNRTIQQLKSSGAMRLIRKQKASDAIINYSEAVDLVYYNQERENQEIFQISSLLGKLLDGNILETMVKGRIIIPPAGNPQLRTIDRDIILDIIYQIHQMKGSLNLIVSRQLELQQTASYTIELLKKEYDINE